MKFSGNRDAKIVWPFSHPPLSPHHIHFPYTFVQSFETIFIEFILIPQASILHAILQMLTLEALDLILRLGFLPGQQLLEEEEIIASVK